MRLSYRARQRLKRFAIGFAIVAIFALLAGAIWFVAQNPYVVYTRNGAKIDKSLPRELSGGKPAEPVKQKPVSIYYNEGENAINTSTELTQIAGYYADTEALREDVYTVLSQVKELPASTPVMVSPPRVSFTFLMDAVK